MSYSLEDLFEDVIQKDLQELLDTKGDHPDPFEHFVCILRNAVRNTNRGCDFARILMDVAINPDKMDLSPENFLKESFQLRYSGSELKKAKYSTEDGAIVRVDYQGEFHE